MMKEPRYIELLAPARNLECGIEAINHGADAVYIGADKFGARSEACNSLEDIRKLTDYAHLFNCRIYVTINTILYDEELNDTEELIRQLYDVGVDALIIQDMAILKMKTAPIALHASTQMDNRSAEKVRWLQNMGFSQVVLARELSLEEIASIHQKVPDMPLEVFVHGALCVSYSGQCYASQSCFGRSANRGECAQFCRLKFNLEDSNGSMIEHDPHLLSLKDINQYDQMEKLLDAGVSSFKIEGRLKDVTYVKNVTAAYHERLNEILARHPEYKRASHGRVKLTFTPSLSKSFNRGFTSYFLDGRVPDIQSFDTPKSMGEFVGTVKEIRGNSFNVSGLSRFVNGDGLCFINDRRELQGFRVNKVENNRLFPLRMPVDLHPGTRLYRNNDHEFELLLSKSSATRKIDVMMSFDETESGYALTVRNDEISVTEELNIEKQTAKIPQNENIKRQLLKLGNTPYECTDIEINTSEERFIPSGLLSELRRNVINRFSESSIAGMKKNLRSDAVRSDVPLPAYPSSKKYLYNVSNSLSRTFYSDQGIDVAPAFEKQHPTTPLIMQCRYCIRYALGYCVKHGGSKPNWHEPLYLTLPNAKRFRLEFDCKDCKMNIYGE